MIIVRFTTQTRDFPNTKEIKRIYCRDEFEKAHDYVYECFDRFPDVDVISVEETTTKIAFRLRRVK